ncbi:MAG: hypothetical protein H6838_09650 [Planctomycetes bacterium]|nr:hypothetical protein [Planctomycetota bacterium]
MTISTLRCSAALLSIALIAASALGQDALRSWSAVCIDTDAYRLPTAQIDTAWYLTAVLRVDGRIYVHGAESGTGICRPPEPPPGLAFTQVAVSLNDGLGLLSDGNIVHWHNNDFILDPVPPLPAGTQYVGVSVGDQHALALRSDGVLVSWHKHIGTTPLGTVQATVPPFPPGVTAVKYKAAVLCSMALLSNGTVVGWGYNYNGELNIPPLPVNTTYIDLWAGNYHFFAKRSDGVIVSWGQNQIGQANLPPLPPGVTFVDFGVGQDHTIALRSDGQLMAWGDNTDGQCNVTQVPPGLSAVQLDASHFTSLVRLSDGSVIGWGGPSGELPLAVPAVNERFADVTCGVAPLLGLTSNGQVLGYGTYYPWLITAPSCPPGLHYEKIHMGWRHAGALRSDGQLVMWGDNPDGRCTVPPLPAGVTYVQAALGTLMTAALRSDGQVVSFGNSPFTPPPLPNGVQYVQVDFESDRPMLLRSDGQVETWPSGGAPTSTVDAPFVKAATGRTLAAVLKADGQAIGWSGFNTPFPIPALPPGVVYVDIDCGDSHFVGRRSDGEVAVWVNATVGQDRVPPLAAGESYVQVDATGIMTAARVGPTRTYVSFASGCAGTQPAARLVPRETPFIGGTQEVRVFDLPQNCAFVVFGWNQTAPLSLAPAMPGCFQHVSVDAAFFVTGQHGNAKFEFPIPDWPGLVGLSFYNQALVFDPGANALGAVVSDAARGVIGRP